MKCETARQHFSDLLDDGADQTLRFAVEHHFSLCSACREEFALFSRTWQMLDDLPLVDPPAGFRASVVAAVREAEARKAERSQPFWRSWWERLSQPVPLRAGFSWSAAAAIVLITAGIWVQSTPDSTALWPFPVTVRAAARTGLNSIDLVPGLSNTGASGKRWDLTVHSPSEPARVRVFAPERGSTAQLDPSLVSTLTPTMGLTRTEMKVLKDRTLRLKPVSLVTGATRGVTPIVVQLSSNGKDRYVAAWLPTKPGDATGVPHPTGPVVLSVALCRIATDFQVAIVADASNDAMVEVPDATSAMDALVDVARQARLSVDTQGQNVYQLSKTY